MSGANGHHCDGQQVLAVLSEHVLHLEDAVTTFLIAGQIPDESHRARDSFISKKSTRPQEMHGGGMFGRNAKPVLLKKRAPPPNRQWDHRVVYGPGQFAANLLDRFW